MSKVQFPCSGTVVYLFSFLSYPAPVVSSSERSYAFNTLASFLRVQSDCAGFISEETKSGIINSGGLK